jgi:pyrroline-5-carboxylate reductase
VRIDSCIDLRAKLIQNAFTMKNAFAGKTFAVLGAGKMGGTLIRAYRAQRLVSASQVVGTVAHADRARALSASLGIKVSTDNRAAAENADVILLCVKPQVMRSVLEEIRPVVNAKTLLISVAASVHTHGIESALQTETPVVRAMPNTPCSVGAGMTGICQGKFARPSDLELARALFDAVGRTVVVDEKLMDAVTGLSASGPAFAFIILESFAEAGVKVGLPRDVATLLASQMLLGAAKQVLDTGDHPALLKDAVTTPAGCTIDGILELEEGKLRVTLIKAVVKATQRAKELVDG